MNPHLQHLIDRERARIATLHQRIAKREQYIKMLLELAQEDEEDLGPLSAAQVAKNDAAEALPGIEASSTIIEPTEPVEAENHTFPKKISANSLKLLWYFGQGQKTLDEATDFSKAEGLGMDRRNISSFANIYRNKFGLIESPAVGMYRLTSRGQEFVDSRYRPVESPVEEHKGFSAEDLV